MGLCGSMRNSRVIVDGLADSLVESPQVQVETQSLDLRMLVRAVGIHDDVKLLYDFGNSSVA